MYETGKAATIAKKMDNYGLQVLGLCETRWTQKANVNYLWSKRLIHAIQSALESRCQRRHVLRNSFLRILSL